MVLSALCLSHPSFSSSSSFSFKLYHSLFTVTTLSNLSDRKRRSDSCRFVVLSTHSNSKILKSNRRSRYGQALSPYEDDEAAYHFGDVLDDDWLLNDDFGETSQVDTNRKTSKSHMGSANDHLNGGNYKTIAEKSNVRNYHYGSKRVREVGHKAKRVTKKNIEDRYPRLTEEISLDEKWLPLIDYLTTFGFKESHFLQMYERHMPSLQINVCSVQERLEYLVSVGVKQRDIRKIVLRQPQILEYTVEKNLKTHVAFLMNLGIPTSRVGQIIAAAPSFFSYSVEKSLKPTVRYLVEEVGIKEKDIGKVVQLSPQILTQRIDISWNSRFSFLSNEIGAPRESIVKMVKKHPQFLHYSIDDGLLPRINFLRSIGMCNSDILKVLTNLTQVLSLSLEENLKPKYKYLVNELNNEVHSLTKYPMYLSLSLDQRIRPRHRFLVFLKKAPKGPFPLSSFVPTDECFCQQWGTSVEKYQAFRERLLLKELAEKFEKKR